MNFKKMLSPSYIILRIQRLVGQQCRSRWGGSFWATSSRPTQFANSAIFVSGTKESIKMIQTKVLIWVTFLSLSKHFVFCIFFSFYILEDCGTDCKSMCLKNMQQNGWMEELQFYSPFNSIFILSWRKGDNERPVQLKLVYTFPGQA